MPLDLFSTFALNRVVEELPTNPAFLLEMFFPYSEVQETESILFDLVEGRRRVSPFVAYNVEGQIVDEIGFSTSSFRPAYIKDKRVFDPAKMFKRRAGERIGGSLTPEQRLAASVTWNLADQLDLWKRRLEVMAAEALFTGKLVISGPKYPTKIVDFQRDPRLTISLTGTPQAWPTVGVDPYDNIEDWMELVYDISKVKPTDGVMTMDVWKVLRDKIGEVQPAFKADGVTPNPGAGLPTPAALRLQKAMDMSTRTLDSIAQKLGPLVVAGQGARLVAILDDLRLWVYNDAHEVPNAANPELPGTEVPNLPAGSFMLLSTGIEGVRYFGAIRDLKAGLQPRQFFVKSWENEDPSVRYMLGQSAPLLVPYRKNAVLAATVL